MSTALRSRILIPARNAEDWRLLLADPKLHWRDGYSAKSLAECWQNAGGLPDEIAALLRSHPDFSDSAPELLFAIPEHQTPLPGGVRPSQTDLLAFIAADAKLLTLGVEGKVDEAFGPTLEEWLQNASDGKRARLRFLCDLLHLTNELPGTIRYQLLHRAASAVVEARRFHISNAVLVIHSFSPTQCWFDDFATWCALFSAMAKPGQLSRLTQLESTTLYAGWATGTCSPRKAGEL
jgi:hypothetical protein